MPTCHRRKITFFHITKTAGTTVEKYLGLYPRSKQDYPSYIMFGNLKDGPSQHYPFEIFYRHRPEVEKDYFKFSFVRNPYDRMVSQYYWQLTRMRNWKGTYSFKTFLLEAEKLVSKGDFFNNDKFMKVPYGNKIHFCPQHMYIFDEEGRVKLDFVGRFENFNQDLSQVCSTIFSKEADNFPADNNREVEFSETQIHNASVGRPPYPEMYDSTTKKIVERMYEKDLDLLKYTF